MRNRRRLSVLADIVRRWERLYQPLTPSRHVSQLAAHQPWTDFDEFTTRQANMRRLTLGLPVVRGVMALASSNLSESGYEQRGC